MISLKKSHIYLTLTLLLWGVLFWLRFAPPDWLIGLPLALFDFGLFVAGFVFSIAGLRILLKARKWFEGKRGLLFLIFLFSGLVLFFPPRIQEPYYPRAPGVVPAQSGSIIPYPVGLPQVKADCPNKCLIDVCTRWVPGPSPRCPNPGPGGGCCLSYGQACDPGCIEPPPGASPPSISGSVTCDQWGSNGWCQSNAKLVLTVSDPQGYSLTITGDAGGTAISCNGNCTVDLPPGSRTATYTVTAAQSGLTASGSTPWAYDPEPPVPDLNIDGTTGSNSWYVSTVTVTAAGSDQISGFANAALSVDGSASRTSATLDDGVHTIVVTGVDKAGNSNTVTKTISVDTVPPALTISITSGTAGANSWFVSPVTVTAADSDTTSGITSTQYRLDGGVWQDGTSVTVSTDGLHTVDFQATDNAGNTSTDSQSFRIDQTAPSSSFTSPSPESVEIGTVQITGTSTDTTSGLSSTEISLDGNTWLALPLTAGSWTYAWDTSSLTNGPVTVAVRASDLAGNVEAPVQLNVNLDNHSPKISLSPSWKIWEAGSLEMRPDVFPLASLLIKVHDPLGRWPNQVISNSLPPPSEIRWDRHFGTILAPPGTYEVIVKACDVNDVCTTVTGRIVIPEPIAHIIPQFFATQTPTPTMLPSPTATLFPTPTAIPKAAPRIAATPHPSLPTPMPTLLVSGNAAGVQVTWPALMIGTFCLGFGFVALSDPRPSALRSLARTISQSMKE